VRCPPLARCHLPLHVFIDFLSWSLASRRASHCGVQILPKSIFLPEVREFIDKDRLY
jgi:hypothetical protein